MYDISGKVINLESDRGIPDLIVVIYDVDPKSWNQGMPEKQRLGSTITKSDGTFQYQFDLSSFYPSDPTGKPDLVICVFAPDQSSSNKNPVGCKDGDRLLYISDCPIYEASTSEVFIIKIKAKNLIASGVMKEFSKKDVFIENDSVSENKKQKEPLIGPSRRNLEIRRKFKSKAKKRVQKILKNSGIPNFKALNFVEPENDSQATMENITSEGINRFNKISGSLKGMKISLDTLKKAFPDLQDNLENGDLENMPESIDGEVLHRHLSEGQLASVGFRENGLNTLCKKMMMSEKAMANTHLNSESEGLGSATETEDPITGEENLSPEPSINEDGDGQILSSEGNGKIERWVEKIMEKSTDNDDIPIPSRPDHDVINRNLEGDLKSGPADAVSYHDFHNLKLALRNVWTRYTDKQLSSDLSTIHENIFAIATDYGLDWEIENEEIEDLESLIESLNSKIEELERVSEMPTELRAWLPEISQKWGNLDAYEQLYIRFLHWFSNFTFNGYKVTSSVHNYVRLEKTSPDTNRATMTMDTDLTIVPGPFPIVVLATFSPIITNLEWNPKEDKSYLKDKALNVLANVENYSNEQNKSTIGRAKRLIDGINDRLSKGFSFDIFKPNTYNFGLLVTYRQQWKPLSYQVGDLVATIPLAPGEKRTFQKKQVINTKRAQKEVELSISTRRFESSRNTRADSEIVNKAQHATNFSMSANGTISAEFAGIGSELSYGTQFTDDQSQESSIAKRNFREAVRKASSEYKNERSLEISTEDSVSSEHSETGEISNPNNEITVTYLFYELQRRYRVREELYKLTPVVLVAMEVPKPHKIDEVWLLENEWIIRRVLLDDSFNEAFDYLTDSFAGDEIGVEILKAQWESQIGLVSELKSDFGLHSRERDAIRSYLSEASKSAYVAENRKEGIYRKWINKLYGDDIDDVEEKAKSEDAELLLEWAEGDLSSIDERLRSALEGLQSATKSYIDGIRQRLNRRVAIDQLRMHIKQNILYYMQAIWAHEPPDQRYFRIYDLPIQVPVQNESMQIVNNSISSAKVINGSGNVVERKFLSVKKAGPSSIKTRELHEITDLSRLIGFKGNYAMFPLTESNGVTDLMAQDYRHEYYGINDPDPKASKPSVEDLLDFGDCILDGSKIRPTNGNNLPDPEFIKGQLEEAIAEGRFNSEDIVIPSGQLYIEALPGNHTVLEDFKLMHRSADVKKVESEIRGIELENTRKAARILSGEHGDPDTEKTLVIDTKEIDSNIDPNI